MKNDIINSAAHYGGKENTYEVIKVIKAWDLGFQLGNTIKYIARAGKKDPKKYLEDLRKAEYYLKDKIHDEELRQQSNPT